MLAQLVSSFPALGTGEQPSVLQTGTRLNLRHRTAKVWKNFTLQYDLKGHQQSVWAVLALEDSHFLTGLSDLCSITDPFDTFTLASADTTIRFWMQNKVIRTYEGHRDAVRGLSLIPDLGFASCSNDRWDECISYSGMCF